MLCCLLVVLFLGAVHIRTTLKEQICLASPHPMTWQLILLRHLPLKAISRFNGFVSQIEFPYWIRILLLRTMVTLYHMNMQEAIEEDIQTYSSLMELFTRRLKDGVRPIHKHRLVRAMAATYRRPLIKIVLCLGCTIRWQGLIRWTSLWQ